MAGPAPRSGRPAWAGSGVGEGQLKCERPGTGAPGQNRVPRRNTGTSGVARSPARAARSRGAFGRHANTRQRPTVFGSSKDTRPPFPPPNSWRDPFVWPPIRRIDVPTGRIEQALRYIDELGLPPSVAERADGRGPKPSGGQRRPTGAAPRPRSGQRRPTGAARDPAAANEGQREQPGAQWRPAKAYRSGPEAQGGQPGLAAGRVSWRPLPQARRSAGAGRGPR